MIIDTFFFFQEKINLGITGISELYVISIQITSSATLQRFDFFSFDFFQLYIRIEFYNRRR